jgi:hypothetical protein
MLYLLTVSRGWSDNHKKEDFMARLNEIVQWQTCSGDKIAVGDMILTPQSQALILRWPRGGVVWNRPVAMVVEQDEQIVRIPIIDLTRMIQITLLGLGLAFGLMTLLRSIQPRRKQNE